MSASRKPPKETDDRFAALLKKWEQDGRRDLQEATKGKLDFLNNVDKYETLKEMQQMVNDEAIQEWNELP